MALQNGAIGTDIGWGIAVGKDQALYLAASFQDLLAFSTDTLVSNGFTDMVIAKFDRNGNPLWARSAGGKLDDSGYGIATDSRNNIYINGAFADTAYFDTIPLISRGYTDIFLARYNSSGNLDWIKNIGGGGTDADEAYAITIDKEDHLYITGKFGGTSIFSSDTLISSGSSDIFIARYDTSGNQVWIRQAGGAGADRGQGIIARDGRSIVVTGYFSQSGFFGSDTLISQGNTDMFVSRYNELGLEEWTIAAGGTGNDEGASITLTDDKKIYVIGYFADTANFGMNTLISFGYYDGFLSDIDSTGTFEWVKQGGGQGADASGAIYADTTGNLYIAGIFDNSCTFDTVIATTGFVQNYFVAKFGKLFNTGIDGAGDESGNLLLFPNPSDGPVSLFFTEATHRGKARVSIHNALGAVMLERDLQFSDKPVELEMGHLSPGVYLLRALVGGSSFCRTFIIR